MPSTPTAVAVYARISSDQEGTGLGVARQVEDCRRLADELGWPVAEEYIDNDLSAYRGKKPRPAYQRMLVDLADGVRDAVLVYHVDRLTRRIIELEQFLEVVTPAGVRHVRFASGGDLDPGNGDGLVMIRMLAVMAASESDTKSRRQRRKSDQVADSGMPHGGRFRPFGYEDDKITVRADEAALIRTVMERYVAGESLRSLAAWLEESGVSTVTGKQWRTSTVRRVLLSARIAGIRDHRGQEHGKAAWEAIITVEERAKVLAMSASKVDTGRRTPRTYLLSGLLRCSRCDGKLFSSSRATDAGRRRRYVCLSGPDHRGCGRLTVVAEPVEDLITDAVLYRLDTPELADAVAGRTRDDDAQNAIAEQLAGDRRHLEELADLYAAKAIGAAEWMRARGPIDARIAAGTRTMARHSGNDALVGLIGNGADLKARWETLALSRRAAIIAAIVDHVVIGPGTSGARELDPERVQPVWRL